jgi:hypothetical protein
MTWKGVLAYGQPPHMTRAVDAVMMTAAAAAVLFWSQSKVRDVTYTTTAFRAKHLLHVSVIHNDGHNLDSITYNRCN